MVRITLLPQPVQRWSVIINNSATSTDAAVVSGKDNTASGSGSIVLGGNVNTAAAQRSLIGNGTNNSVGAQGTNSTIAGGQNNRIAQTGTATGSFIGGGNNNEVTATYGSIVAGSENLASANSAFVGGGVRNISSGTYASTAAGQNNTASAPWSSIGGGQNSMATQNYATVAGGFTNTASGAGSTVGGGRTNGASGASATVSGGERDTAAAGHATVVGGRDNTASGIWSTVLGGDANTASGLYSAVGGQSATAGGRNSFVWGRNISSSANGSVTFADNDPGNGRVNFPFNVTTQNRFTGVFAGGYVLHTSSRPVEFPNAGVTLAPNGTAWQALSDRGSKTDFEEVDTVAVLEKVAAMPMTTWKYKHDSKTRYMGVMSQDLYDAFELGEGDKTINTLVADGVQIAAIQGLNLKLEQKVQEIDGLKKKQAALEAKMDRLEKLITDL